jgi:hypothetical protein
VRRASADGVSGDLARCPPEGAAKRKKLPGGHAFLSVRFEAKRRAMVRERTCLKIELKEIEC